MTENERQEEKAYLHFKSLNKEELAKLLLLLDDEFEILKEIIQEKINHLSV